MSKDDETVPVNVRMKRKLRDQMRAAVKKSENNPYATNISRIVERGVQLALRELKEIQHTGST